MHLEKLAASFFCSLLGTTPAEQLQHGSELGEDDALGTLVARHHLLYLIQQRLDLRTALELGGRDLIAMS